MIQRLKNILFKPVFRKALGALSSQGLLSLTNFIVGLSLIKFSTKEEYGLYSNAFATVLFFVGIQNALISTPLTVLGAHQSAERRDYFIRGLSGLQLIVFIPILLLMWCVLKLSSNLFSPLNIENFVVIFILLIFFVLINEFTKAIYYSQLTIRPIVSMDLTFGICVLAGIGILVLSHLVSFQTVLFCLCLSYFVSVSLGNILLKKKLRLSFKSAVNAFKETVSFSKWALVGVLFTFFQTWGYVYIVSLFVGLKDTAEVSAARLILMPINLVILSWGKIFLPKGVIYLGDRKFSKLSFLYIISCVILWGILGIYVFVLFGARSFIFSKFFPQEYEHITAYVLVWAVVFGASIFRSCSSWYLQALKEFKQLALAVVASSVVTLSATMILLESMGAMGSVLGIVIGEITLGVICGLMLRNRLRGRDASLEAV